MSDSDERPEREELRAFEFEGTPVRSMDGRLPAITLEMEEGYLRGMHLRLALEVRVRNVRYEEDRKGDLTRLHVFALEEARILEAFDPATHVTNVGGGAAGDVESWEAPLLAYVRGETSTLEVQRDDELPERLNLLIEDSELREAYGKGPGYVQDLDAVVLTPEAGF